MACQDTLLPGRVTMNQKPLAIDTFRRYTVDRPIIHTLRSCNTESLRELDHRVEIKAEYIRMVHKFEFHNTRHVRVTAHWKQFPG